jgi:hypothetical protein
MAKPWYPPLMPFHLHLGFEISESFITPILLTGQLL